MTDIVLVNASTVWTDAQAQAVLPGLQTWDDTYVRPAWGLDKCTYHFARFADFQAGKTTGTWPLFLNRHSIDASALGWHDQTPDGSPFGRVFIGDCIRYGISPTVDLSHEAGEMRLNPHIAKYYTLPDGRVCPVELCDAVESDECGIAVGNMLFTDIVTPNYFSTKQGVQYDVQSKLRAPCPSLTPGGYQSIYDTAQGWHQVTALYLGGPPSFRSGRFHNSHRGLQLRASIPPTGAPQP